MAIGWQLVTHIDKQMCSSCKEMVREAWTYFETHDRWTMKVCVSCANKLEKAS